MPDFKAKMHLIRFRLGLHPRPLAGFKGFYLKVGEGRREEEGKGGDGRAGERGGRGAKGEEEGEGPQ